MLGEPKLEGKDEENLTHFFRHYLHFRYQKPSTEASNPHA